MTPYLGEIKMFAGNFAIRGWAFCNGQLVPIKQNTALFSIIGTFYGGNGTSNFALPNLQGATATGQGQGPGLSPRAIGQAGGEAAVTLNLPQLAAHNHPVACAGGGGTQAAAAGGVWAGNGASRGGQIYADTSNASMNQMVLSATGNTLPHNNMPPYLVLNFMIALTGIFPTRS